MNSGIRTDPRVEAYLAAAPEFARPILRHLRELIHQGCPEVEETMKWSRPFFEYHGKILCNMAAFKAHCTLGFWYRETRVAVERDSGREYDAGGQFGRITRIEDLPDAAALRRYVAEAVQMIDSGRPAGNLPSGRKSSPKPELPLPDDLSARLKENPHATAAFKKFSPSCRREYIEWITGAKRPETREKRLAAAATLIAEGKPRHWKYQA